MSAFGLELNSENVVGDSNIRLFSSPKLSEKDLYAICTSSSEDRSFKLSSPVPLLGDYKINAVGSLDQHSFLSESSVLEESNTSIAEDVTTETSAESETSEQRMEREDRESQELAWQLMQEENMEVYNMQMQFMRENADQMSEEDLALIQAMINESGQPQQAEAPAPIGADEDDQENNELNESDSSNWDYERLLQLGQQIGGTTQQLLNHTISQYF